MTQSDRIALPGLIPINITQKWSLKFITLAGGDLQNLDAFVLDLKPMTHENEMVLHEHASQVNIGHRAAG